MRHEQFHHPERCARLCQHSGGIGAALAQAPLAAGCRVAVNYGQDKLDTEPGIIYGITLLINGGECLS